MSDSRFHAHFKAVTAMSPLQFQKQLRLQEARRLMLSKNLEAAVAGSRVGYDDALHFSREYKRHFGGPPMRDVKRLRAGDGVSPERDRPRRHACFPNFAVTCRPFFTSIFRSRRATSPSEKATSGTCLPL